MCYRHVLAPALGSARTLLVFTVTDLKKISTMANSCSHFYFPQENLGFSSKTTFFCRGHALPAKLLDFLAGFDINVHSAYGQTESASVLTANVPGR